MLFLYSRHCLLTGRSNSVTVAIVTIMFEEGGLSQFV